MNEKEIRAKYEARKCENQMDSDRQMRRLGECLIDLERTGSREVQIIPKE